MKFLDYVLDDLMPWHRDQGLRDFSLLEVNRYVLLGDYVQYLKVFSIEMLPASKASAERHCYNYN